MESPKQEPHKGRSRVDRQRRLQRLIGVRIRQLRLARGYTHEKLALRAGFARPYFSAVERGERNVSALNLARIAASLNVEVGVLFPPLAELFEDEQNTATQMLADETIVVIANKEPITESGEVLVSISAAAEIVGVSTRTIARWVAQGVLQPAAKIVTKEDKQLHAFWPQDIQEIVALGWGRGRRRPKKAAIHEESTN